MLSAIWAQDKNGLIGKDDKLPWHLPSDLRFFKEKTVGNTIVMGRTTFEGMGKRALPHRTTIVLTTNPSYDAGNNEILVMHSVSEVLIYANQSEKPTFIVGGAKIYKAFEPYLDSFYVTKVEETFDGDTHFPEWSWEDFEKITEEQGVIDEKNRHSHIFEYYQRIAK